MANLKYVINILSKFNLISRYVFRTVKVYP